MVLGILQFELSIPGAESLKDKRRVVKSLKDKLHREHLVSVAEVAALEEHRTAVLGLALVGTDGRRVGEILDKISAKLRNVPDAELADITRELLHGRAAGSLADPETGTETDPELASDLLARADEPDEEHRQ